MKNLVIMTRTLLSAALAASFAACSDSNDPTPVNPNAYVGKAVGNFTAEEWSPGGTLGTTTNEQGCYANPSPATEEQGFYSLFKKGELFFESNYSLSLTSPFRGLGPASVRSGCTYCHPNYGHGKRQNAYNSDIFGNGYLLVIYHNQDAPDGSYKKNGYISEVTGMPQTQSMLPFKAPVDESKISLEWLTATDEHNNTFPDGETYNLTYPDVQIPIEAFNTNPKPENYEVRLESTIGLYGTGLLDAISGDSMKAQYQRAAQYAELNPAMWDKEASDWASTAWYTLADGTKMIKKFTYALTRASLQDGPGANAIWNITNVTRSDRDYLYTTKAWAKAMSEDDDVVNYIQKQGATSSLLNPYYGDGSEDSVKYLVNKLLGLNSKADTATYRRYFVDAMGEEMSDENYYAFAVWHRGLAVPQARDLDKAEVQRGKELFYQMGCTSCHRPSWKIEKDEPWLDMVTRGLGKDLPRYDNQTIWPYSDLVQHRLFMVNDIRTGWCRTTPLWGRGLSQQETGASERLHDCRAQTVVEAIMWHGYSSQSDAYTHAQKFYNLSKSDRDAVVAFIEAI